MAGYSSAFGRGLIVGAGAALLYAAARDYGSLARSLRGNEPSDETAESRWELLDWRLAARIADRASGGAPALHPAARAQLQAEYEQLLREIERPIADYTGNDLSLANTEVVVMDRPAWIRANMESFRVLLQPVEDLYREQVGARSDGWLTGGPGMRQAARLMLSAEMGVLVGYLSRRVLGQYDLALASQSPGQGGKLYFVEPNLRQVESTLGVGRSGLRRWVALHEATHAHEFELHPWVRAYLNTSMRAYLRLLVDDMRRHNSENMLVALATRLANNLRRGHNVMAALMTPEQRELLSRLQALMSLAEGYSNHVMNAVGRQILPDFESLHSRVEQRQMRRSQAETLFLRLTGLSMKMEQYRRGEQFVNEVARLRDIHFVNRAWQTPDNLPTEAELADPARWIAHLEATAE